MKKFVINSNTLLEGLQPLMSIIQDKHIIPILECIKIEILDNKMYLIGDNAEINCVNILEIWTQEKLSFCVNFNMLLSIVKNIHNQEIEFKVDDKQVQIFHKKGDFKLPVFSANEFPEIKKGDLSKKVKLKGAALKSALKVANKFILNSDLEPMSNISIEIGKKTIIRSTNKVCLFEEKIKGEGDAQNLLISGKASTAIYNLIQDKELELNYNENRLFISSENRHIIILQQQGDFPVVMFDKILHSTEGSEDLIVDFDEFITSLKRTTILSSSDHDNLVKLDITPVDIELSCDNKDISTKAHETIPATFNGERTVGYNAKLLIEILSVFDKKVDFSINANNFFCMNSKKKKGLIACVLLKD